MAQHYYAISKSTSRVLRFRTREARDTCCAVPSIRCCTPAKYRFPSPVQSAVRRGDVRDAEGSEG